MLRRQGAAALGLAVLVVTGFGGATTAVAAGGTTCNQLTGVCQVSVGDGGSEGSPGGPPRDAVGDGKSAPQVCSKTDGSVVPCSGPGGAWFNSQQCYAAPFGGSTTDSPFAGSSDPVYVCGGNDLPRLFSVPAAQAPPPPPDPRVLAQQAIDQMQLRAIKPGMAPPPGSNGSVIGLPTWMWVADPGPSTTGPQTRSVTAAGWTVTATATMTGVRWNMGDGSEVVCGRGTAYERSFGANPSPDCGHTYTDSGDYTVTATSSWRVDWEGIGQSGSIPMTFTSTSQVTAMELQAIGQQ